MDVEEVYREFEPYNGTVNLQMVKKVITAYTLSSQHLKDRYLMMLEMLHSRMKLSALRTDKPFLKLPTESKGQINIGKFAQGCRSFADCLLNPDQLIQTCIVSAPNKGKTRLLFRFCKEIETYNLTQPEEKRIGIIILDRKQDFRNIDIDKVVLTLDDLFINIFDPPPACDARKWLSDISQLLMSVWGFFYASRNYFMNISNNLYESKHKVPTLFEVYEAIKDEQASARRLSGRRMEIQEVNLDRIENILQEFGKCCVARKSFPLWQFIDSTIPLVIEADVSNDSFALLLGWLLLYIYRYRKSNDIRGNISEGGTVVICDEAYLLWEAAKDYSESRRELGANFISQAPLYIRDFRTAIVAASQRPLSPDFMTATNLKIVGYVGDYDDAKYLANSLGDPDLVDVIPTLDVGEFIIKIGDRDPALLRTEDYPVQRIDDLTLKEMMKPFVEYVRDCCREEEQQKESEPQRKQARLSDDAKNLLLDVCAYPESTISARYYRLNLKGRSAQEVVSELLESGYAELVVENIENNKPAKYLVPTLSGLECLKSCGRSVEHLQHIGKVSPLHALYQNMLLTYLKRLGWKVKHDYQLTDKFVDIYAEDDKRRVAFEIALNPAIDANRVVSALSKVDEYVFLCKDVVTANTLESQLKNQSDKIKYFIATNFITDLKKATLDIYQYNIENNQNNQKKQNSDSNNRENQENWSDA